MELSLFFLYTLLALVQSVPIYLDNSLADRNQVFNYFTEYGYLPKTREGNSVDYTELLPFAIEDFQKMARIPQTGSLDTRTLDMMNKERCGVRDPVKRSKSQRQKRSKSQRQKRYSHADSKWETSFLTWKVTHFSSQLTRREVLDVLNQAFKVWSDVTNLYFQYVEEGDADIEVRFSRGNHNDGYRFDGVGGMLAHAFFPPQPSDKLVDDISGDIHFDDSERWIVNLNYVGQGLLSVAVHEIGHSLGLQHSNVDGSVMWPWSKVSSSSALQTKLVYDDILAIQTLYGGKSLRVTRNENSHVLCGHVISAAVKAVDNDIYIFSEHTARRLDPTTLDPVESLSISSVFQGFPSDRQVDAAVTFKGFWSVARTYLISGTQYYRYSVNSTGQMNVDSGYPKSFYQVWGDFARGKTIRASFTFRNGNTLVFVIGSEYWIHTGTSFGPYESYPKPLSGHHTYKQLSTAMDAGFLHPNGTNYFFTDGKIHKLGSDGNLKALCAA